MRRKNSQGESNDHKSACVRDSVWCACPAEKQGEGQKEEKRKWKLLHMFFLGGGLCFASYNFYSDADKDVYY